MMLIKIYGILYSIFPVYQILENVEGNSFMYICCSCVTYIEVQSIQKGFCVKNKHKKQINIFPKYFLTGTLFLFYI